MKRTLFNHPLEEKGRFHYKWVAFLPVLALFLIFLPSCDKEEGEAAKYTVSVTAQFPEGYADGAASDIEVKATNTQTGKDITAKTNADGAASFSLVSGIYNFSVAHETEEFAFNGLSENETVAANKTVTLKLHASALSGGLVIKEIYYSGSAIEGKSGTGYYSDSFTEIYNNSDETIYLDNIGYGALDPTSSGKPSVWADENGNLPDRLPLFGYSFYFKGSGKDYPLAPRTSIVIAMDGIDHKSDPAGNPNSPVNLANADWELYVGHINSGKDADAPDVPNMEVLYSTTPTQFDALYSTSGPAMAIFRFPEGTNPENFAKDENNLSTKPGKTKPQHLLIPKDYMIDVVECVHHDANKRNKRVPSELDAGITFISKGTYSSLSVRRKVKQIIDGKVIYKDTNNSTEDFLQDQTPTPFVHPTTVDQ